MMRPIPVIIDGKRQHPVHCRADWTPLRMFVCPLDGKLVRMRLHKVGDWWEYREDEWAG